MPRFRGGVLHMSAIALRYTANVFTFCVFRENKLKFGLGIYLAVQLL